MWLAVGSEPTNLLTPEPARYLDLGTLPGISNLLCAKVYINIEGCMPILVNQLTVGTSRRTGNTSSFHSR